MHKQDKWTHILTNKKMLAQSNVRPIYEIIQGNAKIGVVWNKDVAKHICQTHNSHKRLLKACKSMIKSLQKDGLTMYVNFQVRKQMREAIAQAKE